MILTWIFGDVLPVVLSLIRKVIVAMGFSLKNEDAPATGFPVRRLEFWNGVQQECCSLPVPTFPRLIAKLSTSGWRFACAS
jgi:hypothetical protein